MEARIARYRRRLREEESPEPEPVDCEKLQTIWHDGNKRRPIPPNLSDNRKRDLYYIEQRWIKFCTSTAIVDWKEAVESLSFANKGLAESFMTLLLSGGRIRAESAIRVNTRQLGGLYHKYTARHMDIDLRDHLLNVIQVEATPKYALRREPKSKPIMGPDLFTYKMLFLWTRDTASFHIGLDRLDDAALRLLYLFTGARKHEFAYTAPAKTTKLLQHYDDESGAFTDIGDERARPTRQGKCWVCGAADERTKNPALGVVCWEDVDLYIIRDSYGNGGRDRLAIQILTLLAQGPQ